MIRLLPLVLALSPPPAKDPLEEAKALLGKEMRIEWAGNSAILATEPDDPTAEDFKQSFAGRMKTIADRAFTPSLDRPLLVCRAGAARFRDCAKRLLGDASNPPLALDPVRNRIVLLAGGGDAALDAVVPGLLLAKHLGSASYPPYLMAGLVLLIENRVGEEDVLFDARAAILKNPLLADRRPALRDFLKLGLAEFNDERRMPVLSALARGWFGYLEAKGALKPFIASYRATMKRDASGVAAAEAALGKPWADIDTDFQAYVRDLPWIDRKRFEETGRAVLGEGMRVRIDDDWALALSGIATDAMLEECVSRAKALAPALVKTFDMTPSGLPFVARLFGDEKAFEAYAWKTAQKEWYSGFYVQKGRTVVGDMSRGSDVFLHELCHGLFIDDFNDLFPTWLGEGLAELFEQFAIDGDTVRGLPGTTPGTIRKAYKDGKAPRLKDFIQMRGVEFHDRARGRGGVDPMKVTLHYTLARAVVLYLQDQGLLVRFYTNLRKTRVATARQDPSCLQALEKETGKGIEGIEKDFRLWLETQPAAQ